MSVLVFTVHTLLDYQTRLICPRIFSDITKKSNVTWWWIVAFPCLEIRPLLGPFMIELNVIYQRSDPRHSYLYYYRSLHTQNNGRISEWPPKVSLIFIEPSCKLCDVSNDRSDDFDLPTVSYRMHSMSFKIDCTHTLFVFVYFAACTKL